MAHFLVMSMSFCFKLLPYASHMTWIGGDSMELEKGIEEELSRGWMEKKGKGNQREKITLFTWVLGLWKIHSNDINAPQLFRYQYIRDSNFNTCSLWGNINGYAASTEYFQFYVIRNVLHLDQRDSSVVKGIGYSSREPKCFPVPTWLCIAICNSVPEDTTPFTDFHGQYMHVI